MERFDYAVFDQDRYVNNAWLTREEAARLEAEGLRCVDVEASVDTSLPRFPDRVIVTSKWHQRRWRDR